MIFSSQCIVNVKVPQPILMLLDKGLVLFSRTVVMSNIICQPNEGTFENRQQRLLQEGKGKQACILYTEAELSLRRIFTAGNCRTELPEKMLPVAVVPLGLILRQRKI